MSLSLQEKLRAEADLRRQAEMKAEQERLALAEQVREAIIKAMLTLDLDGPYSRDDHFNANRKRLAKALRKLDLTPLLEKP